MKGIRLIYLLIFILIVLAHKTNAQTPPDFNAKDAAWIYTYDYEAVVKKLKIQDEETRKSIYKSIGEYNMKIYQLSDKHSTTFTELDAYFDQQVRAAMQQRDRSKMNGVKSKIMETIPPIRMEVMHHEKTLNASMESLLDDKQNKKWLSYQRSKKPQDPGMGG